MKYLLFIFLFFGCIVNAQIVNKTDSNRVRIQDSVIVDSGAKDSLVIFKPTILDYKFYTQFSAKKILDTVLTYDKTYIFTQYNNRDNFGKIQFANIGTGFNPLIYEHNPEQNLTLLPFNKAHNILGIKDIRYYDVKTPTAIFVYHNAMRNGVALNSTYTQNIGKTFNFAIEYMGLRSLGNYSNNLAVNNNTVFSGHFKSRNNKYEAFAHFIHQNVNSEENGGIVNDSLFISGAEAYSNRANVEVNLQGVDSRFSYRRYYLSHQFSPFNPERFPFKLQHTISHQGNKYFFSQTGLQPFFYDQPTQIISGFPVSTGKYSNNLSNTVALIFDYEKFQLNAGIRHQNIAFGVYEPLEIGQLNVPQEIREDRIGAVGNLKINLWNKMALNADLEISRGEHFGNFIRTANTLHFEPFTGYFIDAKVNFQSSAPSFNYLLNTSPYRKMNYNFMNFKNQNILEIGGNMNLKWFNSQLFAQYFRVDNFTYFNAEGQPAQSNTSVNISQIGGEATFHFNKFRLNTRVLFQNTLTNKELFPAPNVIGRANLFYQTKAFKNAAELQGGIKVHYFTKFDSRDYFPVLNEFTLQNANPFSIGGKPIVDAYINMKVKRMFFFVEGQHLNTILANNTTYTAPHYPFYDFRINIGIVWYMIN